MSDAMPTLRVMVVDDHPMMRRGITGVLAEADRLVVVAEAGDGLAAQALYRQHLPDVTLMDLAMPRCGGVEAIRAIRAAFPHACIVALTTFDGDGQIQRALDAGATGYLLKSALCEGLPDALRAAFDGSSVLAPELARTLTAGRSARITPRERDVLALVAQGHSNRGVASELGIAEETIKTYISNILQKLQTGDRTEAVVIALRRGLID